MAAELDFQIRLSIFLNMLTTSFKRYKMQNLKQKLFLPSLCFKGKGKIKQIKQKDYTPIYEILGINVPVNTGAAISRCLTK